jgi:hypothetical protein
LQLQSFSFARRVSSQTLPTVIHCQIAAPLTVKKLDAHKIYFSGRHTYTPRYILSE